MKLKYMRVSYGLPANSARSMERILEGLWDVSRTSVLGAFGEWRPPIDVYQTDEHITVQMEMAGVQEDNVDVTLFDDVLVIKGTREPQTHRGEQVIYHEAGIRYGQFKAIVYLPAPVDGERTDANYINGFLTVTLPKQPVSAPTNMTIE